MAMRRIEWIETRISALYEKLYAKEEELGVYAGNVIDVLEAPTELTQHDFVNIRRTLELLEEACLEYGGIEDEIEIANEALHPEYEGDEEYEKSI